jgi:hypothetical protein
MNVSPVYQEFEGTPYPGYGSVEFDLYIQQPVALMTFLGDDRDPDPFSTPYRSRMWLRYSTRQEKVRSKSTPAAKVASSESRVRTLFRWAVATMSS